MPQQAAEEVMGGSSGARLRNSATAETSMTELKIEGMRCMHCVKMVTEAIIAVKGVEGEPRVTLDPGAALIAGSASPKELIAAVKTAGYEASLKS
jgi:copper chaperone